MRTAVALTALAALTPALAKPTNPFSKKAKSPIPVEAGFNKALVFTLDAVESSRHPSSTQNDLVGGEIAEDNGVDTFPFVTFTNPLQSTDNQPKGPYRPPPAWNGGECCKPTSKCHAYLKWMVDMESTHAWETDFQRSEANSHVECCMRQYRASCDYPMEGTMVVWRDPRMGCSPNGPMPVEGEKEMEKEETLEKEKKKHMITT